MTKLKIASYNISGGFYVGNEDEEYLDRAAASTIDNRLLKEIIDTINNEDIDIICLQEVITTEAIQYIERIVEGTTLKHYDSFRLSPCNIIENTDAGLAIISKYPIDRTIKDFFPNPNIQFTTASGNTYSTYDKGYMISYIVIDNTLKLRVFNHHNFPYRRFRSTAKNNMPVFEHFNEVLLGNEPHIVLGDYNTDDFVDLVPELKNNYIRTIDAITTVDGKRFDEIMLRKGTKYSSKMIKGLSDHFMVMAEIEV